MNLLQTLLAMIAMIGFATLLYYLLPIAVVLVSLWNRNTAIARGAVVREENKARLHLFLGTIIFHAILMALGFYFFMYIDGMSKMLFAVLTLSVTMGAVCGDLKSCIAAIPFPFILYFLLVLGWIPLYFFLWYVSRPIERMVTRRPERFRKFSETLNSSPWEVAKKYPLVTLLFLLVITSVIGVIKFGGF